MRHVLADDDVEQRGQVRLQHHASLVAQRLGVFRKQVEEVIAELQRPRVPAGQQRDSQRHDRDTPGIPADTARQPLAPDAVYRRTAWTGRALAPTPAMISRSQGLKGALKVIFEHENLEAIDELKMVYLRNLRGDYFPSRIQNIRVEGKGNKLSFFVQFEHIADRTGAEALKNHAVFLETDKALDFLAAAEIDQTVIDYHVYDSNEKHIGIITDILENPAQSTLVIATESGSLLVPYVDQFIVDVDDDDEIVICQNLQLLEGI